VNIAVSNARRTWDGNMSLNSFAPDGCMQR
jgi:hypothetical protein